TFRKDHQRSFLAQHLDRLPLSGRIGGDIEVHRECAEHSHHLPEHWNPKRLVPRHVVNASHYWNRYPDRIRLGDVVGGNYAGAFERDVFDTVELDLEQHPAQPSGERPEHEDYYSHRLGCRLNESRVIKLRSGSPPQAVEAKSSLCYIEVNPA